MFPKWIDAFVRVWYSETTFSGSLVENDSEFVRSMHDIVRASPVDRATTGHTSKVSDGFPTTESNHSVQLPYRAPSITARVTVAWLPSALNDGNVSHIRSAKFMFRFEDCANRVVSVDVVRFVADVIVAVRLTADVALAVNDPNVPRR